MGMAEQQNTENNNLETKEPLPMIQKIDQNGESSTRLPLLKIKKSSEKAMLPSRISSLSAGYDLYSAHDTEVPARGKALIRTDLSIAIPEETYARIAPRLKLAWKNSIHVGAGVVDADYRGLVGVILYNYSYADFNVKAGDRIAQLIIKKIMTPEVLEVEDLDSTVRGSVTSCMGLAEQQNMENNLETKEPLPNIQKIDENGGSPTLPPLLKVKKLSEKAILPSVASSLSAGYDLSSAHDTEVPARGKALIRTDLSIAVPEETYARVAPRSGLAWKNSINVGAGVVDADYRGQVSVILYNHSDADFKVKAGDRIAQLIIERIMTPEVLEVEDLDSTSTALPKIRKIDQNSGSPTLPPLLKVRKLSENAILPSRPSSLSAGYDLSSAHDTEVPARGKALIQTDLSIAIPEETHGRIAPRFGLAWKNFIDVGAGVIDSNYRGEVGVILFNHSSVDFKVKAGDRIAQLIIERIMTLEVMEVEDLDSTVRGVGGFGSTGV